MNRHNQKEISHWSGHTHIVQNQNLTQIIWATGAHRKLHLDPEDSKQAWISVVDKAIFLAEHYAAEEFY